ncbi:unnamed protein product [Tilletia controversa]|uniref:Uncharacterized protein n=2 Tax=Tilletia TaxID=13289 RepID=A0A9N8M8P0_9BASI|nr:unnamed protein product [Tilletia caries]CAD6912676.1 unnamed protein product [Tilletia laevis]CAD6914494.1 unnamed protein product [Tilletia controversa]CAD6921521.1 unnamed protein product [Tilletia controversa]CAD6926850.1 unnamed protein product [Tilletia caries]
MNINQLASLELRDKEGSDSDSGSGNGSKPRPCIIHEQNKKAVGHLDARLGDRVGDQKSNDYQTYSLDDPDVKPWIFRFVCLSRLGLQLKGFLPHEEFQEQLEREQRNKKRTQEQAILDARESHLLEEVERIKRKRATLDAQMPGSSQAGGSSSSQVNVKPEPDRVPFDFKDGGRSMEDPLVIDD